MFALNSEKTNSFKPEIVFFHPLANPFGVAFMGHLNQRKPENYSLI